MATRRPAGFTLIELMVVVVIATLLLSIAIPGYQNQVLKSRRTEAKTAVLDLATREERFYSATNSYSQTPSDLGYAAAGASTAFPLVIGNGYYTLNVSAPTPTPLAIATFTITATATGAQVSDAPCATFTVDSTGKQTAANSSGTDTTQNCWN